MLGARRACSVPESFPEPCWYHTEMLQQGVALQPVERERDVKRGMNNSVLCIGLQELALDEGDWAAISASRLAAGVNGV